MTITKQQKQLRQELELLPDVKNMAISDYCELIGLGREAIACFNYYQSIGNFLQSDYNQEVK